VIRAEAIAPMMISAIVWTAGAFTGFNINGVDATTKPKKKLRSWKGWVSCSP